LKSNYFTNPVQGVLVVDKPDGWTSHDVCHFIRKRFRIKKVGHAGVLDKPATGVLVVLLGHFTKMSSKFLNQDKEYRAVMRFGARTSTHDATGTIVEEKPCDHLTESSVREAFDAFKGELEQLPPMASSVKQNGVRLYKLALQGKEVERPTKLIKVHELVIDRLALPEVEFTCHVSKGTYVRTLANDIGLHLNTCAHLSKLIRTASGSFRLENSITVDKLKSFETIDELRPFIQIPTSYASSTDAQSLVSN